MSAEIKHVAMNLRRFAIAVATHQNENPSHNAYGIGLNRADMDRLGFEQGEMVVPGILIEEDTGTIGAFRILCDGEHEENPLIEAYREMIKGPREAPGEPVEVPAERQRERVVTHA